jgi:hypothetical protein
MSQGDKAAYLDRLFVQMDAPGDNEALAAKQRVASLLTGAELSFGKIGEQIEQRRLLLSPDIVAAIKRIDLKGEGDAAFIGTRKMLARAKLSFQHIAEALDASSVHPAEYAALERELCQLRAVYVRQQIEIAGLKILLGSTRLTEFLRYSWRPIFLASVFIAIGFGAFQISRGLVAMVSSLVGIGHATAESEGSVSGVVVGVAPASTSRRLEDSSSDFPRPVCFGGVRCDWGGVPYR